MFGPLPGRDRDKVNRMGGGEREKMCSSKDPVFMQMLLLTQREKGKGYQAELARQSQQAVRASQSCSSSEGWMFEKHRWRVTGPRTHNLWALVWTAVTLPTQTWALGPEQAVWVPGSQDTGHLTAGSYCCFSRPLKAQECFRTCSGSHKVLLNRDSALANPIGISLREWWWWWADAPFPCCLLFGEWDEMFTWGPSWLFMTRKVPRSTFVDSQWSVDALPLSHIPAQFTAFPPRLKSPCLGSWLCHLSLLHVLPPPHEAIGQLLYCFRRCYTGWLGKPSPQIVSWAHNNINNAMSYTFQSSFADLVLISFNPHNVP